jgi:hypothetical protein
MRNVNTTIRIAFYRNRFSFVLASSLLLIAGCLADYGQMERSREINAVFESYQVLPDYSYYYTGWQNNPRVIMGIHKDYTLKTGSWSSMGSITSDMLKKRIEGMTNQIGQAAENYGWVIFNPAREKVGIWYSKLDQTTVKFGKNKEIFVSQPKWEDANDRLRFNAK